LFCSICCNASLVICLLILSFWIIRLDFRSKLLGLLKIKFG
jgi:hypothetical protein